MGLFRTRLGILFVCTANICRSPTVESVFRAAADRAGLRKFLRIDSAGVRAGHLGERIDPRAIVAMRDYGVVPAAHRARQVQAADFRRFDWILAMDASNLRALRQIRPKEYGGRLDLLMSLVPNASHAEIPDPYFGTPQTFDLMVRLALAASDALVMRLAQPLG